MYQSNESDYSINHGQPLTDINQINLLSSNDDIKKNICDSDTLIEQRTLEPVFPLDDNELNFIENINLVTREAVQDVIDSVVNESVSTNAISVISPCTSYFINNSDDFTLNVHYQIAQTTVPKELSTSLQFVHDVHPYQKTQHDKDIFDKLLDRMSIPAPVHYAHLVASASRALKFGEDRDTECLDENNEEPESYSLDDIKTKVMVSDEKIADDRWFK
ncbi:unnamed protein product [Rotaria sp. Silwood1]|nr:unnamed protein product [Rotaria sp. Silwood1]CAF4905437.1 unnamed protein product [Rotaria sp. Silwood1]